MKKSSKLIKEYIFSNSKNIQSPRSETKSIIAPKTLNKKQILITGGVGFVGHHLVKRLVARKYFPIIIDNLSNSSLVSLSGISKKKYFFVKADVRNLKEIEKAIFGFKPNMIIHLAALHFIPYCDKHPKEVSKVNLKGTENLLKKSKIALKFPLVI